MPRHARLVPVLVLTILLASCREARESIAIAGPPASEGYVDAGNGVQLYYRTMGTGSDTVVVLHGGPGFSMAYLVDDLTPLATRLVLVFYDQRGTGRSTLVSDSTSLDARRFVEDLEAVRREFGLERMKVLAHSWGAGLVALYGQEYPERLDRMVLVGPVPLRKAQLDQALAEMDTRRDAATRAMLVELREARMANPGDADACRVYHEFWFRGFFGDTAAARRGQGDFCAGTSESLANKVRGVDRYTMASLGDWDWRGMLRMIAAPTLVIHGTSDAIPQQSALDWVDALPHASTFIFHDVGHFPWLEAGDSFFAAADTFLRVK